MRLVKQASRNGAAQIHVRDNTGHLTLGYKAEYFTFRQEYTQWKLVKQLEPIEEKLLAEENDKAKENLRDTSCNNSHDISINPLDTTDVKQMEAYCDLENECFKTVPGGVKREVEQLLSDIAEGEQCFWLCDGDAHAGFFSVKKVDNELELESLGVSPSYRGKGIGTVGLSAFEAMARRTGCESSFMICADCNPAIRLYEENGYQRVKEFSHWYVTSDEKKKG